MVGGVHPHGAQKRCTRLQRQPERAPQWLGLCAQRQIHAAPEMAFDARALQSQNALCSQRPASVKLTHTLPRRRLLPEKKICARQPPRRRKLALRRRAQQLRARLDLLHTLARGVEPVGLLDDFLNILHRPERIQEKGRPDARLSARRERASDTDCAVCKRTQTSLYSFLLSAFL